MDYYEELGISPSATAEEIGRAYRRLTKLLHPDQQMDEGMKSLAQTQMRRLNAIVETLTDPERRREYDEQLWGVPEVAPVGGVRRSARMASFRVVPSFGRITWRSIPWWVSSTVGAIVLTAGAVWFWADDLGSSFGNSHSQVYVRQQPQDAIDSPAGAGQSITAEPAPQENPGALRRLSSRIRQAILPSKATKPKKAVKAQTLGAAATRKPTAIDTGPPEAAPASAPERRPFRISSPEIARVVPKQAEVLPPPRVTLNAQRIDAPPVPLPTVPVGPVSKPVVSSPAPSNAATANAASTSGRGLSKTNDRIVLTGDWIYAPKTPEKPKAGVYPPEFIDLKFYLEAGALHGEYRARYRVTDRPIPPDVAFLLSSADSSNRKFSWSSSNGSRGILKLSPIDASSIRVEWQTTTFTRGPSLTAGTAVLVRRSP